MKTSEITQAALASAVNYDPVTGVFTRVGRNIPNAPCGAQAGYRRLKIHGTRFMAHRMAWLYVYGKLPEGDIDHINGNPGDNAIANLRDVSHRVNMQNRRRSSLKSKTGFLGVWMSKGKFVASISHLGKSLKLGRFTTAEEAHEAYLSKKRSLHQGCTI
jgi:hypothetical protein